MEGKKRCQPEHMPIVAVSNKQEKHREPGCHISYYMQHSIPNICTLLVSVSSAIQRMGNFAVLRSVYVSFPTSSLRVYEKREHGIYKECRKRYHAAFRYPSGKKNRASFRLAMLTRPKSATLTWLLTPRRQLRAAMSLQVRWLMGSGSGQHELSICQQTPYHQVRPFPKTYMWM